MSTNTNSNEQALKDRLAEFADRMARMMRDYDLPEECNDIIVAEVDATNQALGDL